MTDPARYSAEKATPRTIHCLAGLPRSGETVMAALFRQNPGLHADVASPLLNILRMAQATMNAGGETSFFFDNTPVRKNVLSAIAQGFYAHLDTNVSAIDTNRLWAHDIGMLEGLYGRKAKLILVLRDVAEVVNSFENALKREPLIPKSFIDSNKHRSIETRVNVYLGNENVVGRSLAAARAAFQYKGNIEIGFVRYSHFMDNPKSAMQKIYDYLEEPFFEHNYDNVEFDRPELDTMIGTPGLHRVSGPVKAQPVNWAFGDNIRTSLQNLNFWRQMDDNTFLV